MSSKFRAPALGALFTLAAIAPAPVFAQSSTPPRSVYGYPDQRQIDDARNGVPRGARASSTAPSHYAPPAGRPFETDPDPHVRFEMNRDDRDRRLGGR